MTTINNYNKLTVSAMSVSDVHKNNKGSNTAYLNLNGTKIIMKSPELYNPFGLSEFETEFGTKYSLDLSFVDIETNPRTKDFYNKIKEIDEFLIEKAVVNSVSWFGKQYKREVIEEFYRPLIKSGNLKKGSTTETYPDSLKIKIRYINNIESYDKAGNKLSVVNDLVPRSKVKTIFEISPIWFINKSFGVSLNLIQMVISKPITITGFCFEDDEED